MKAIQIAPHTEDCTITEKSISGKMDGRVFTFTLPKGCTFDLKDADQFILSFQQAIAICSKHWQIEDLLNTHFGITGGKFTEA